MIGVFLPPAAPLVAARSSQRLYSPLTLAIYAWAFNLPIATVLLGINFRRRGRRTAGNLLIVGSAALAALMSLVFAISSDPPDLRLFALLGGLLIFGAEKPAFAAAIRQGASKARWWPPLLIVLATSLAAAGAVLVAQRNQ